MEVKRNYNILVRLGGIFVVCLICFTSCSESVPVFPRWFDYDYFPEAKPISDSGTGQVVGTVNPLRPYEPWVVNCILYSGDKVEPGKRHERCKFVDENNEKAYANFLIHVQQWEQAYPERATKWNERFPDAKAKEKQKYEQLKAYVDYHNANVSQQSSEDNKGSNSSRRATTIDAKGGILSGEDTFPIKSPWHPF